MVKFFPRLINLFRDLLSTFGKYFTTDTLIRNFEYKQYSVPTNQLQLFLYIIVTCKVFGYKYGIIKMRQSSCFFYCIFRYFTNSNNTIVDFLSWYNNLDLYSCNRCQQYLFFSSFYAVTVVVINIQPVINLFLLPNYVIPI